MSPIVWGCVCSLSGFLTGFFAARHSGPREADSRHRPIPSRPVPLSTLAPTHPAQHRPGLYDQDNDR